MASILVIEDAPLVRRAVRAVLERAGHVVSEAANGTEGLARLAEQPADLVIADIWMPELDGIQFLKQARQRFPLTWIVVMSGGGPMMPLEQSATLAETFGADAVLYKPFEDDDLLACLGPLLGQPRLV